MAVDDFGQTTVHLTSPLSKIVFPFQTVDDMLEELYSVTYFTKLDIRAGYHQVRVNPFNVIKLLSVLITTITNIS